MAALTFLSGRSGASVASAVEVASGTESDIVRLMGSLSAPASVMDR